MKVIVKMNNNKEEHDEAIREAIYKALTEYKCQKCGEVNFIPFGINMEFLMDFYKCRFCGYQN
ncbi:hypothetical protein Bccel_1617 [Pseudobacteroides cellulosolvens ATCC 35603 = DSM 2933]|uniref:Uncharacterized protein n=2 Tax=Pseudobacteroides cellulosolvens TaxID=35825 RepID=A0A0L6JKR9_9FIRM|nr:hypothetical protein Bccel_1617 [Pseudobacteroides cellulosolvens ATCC 35603 = DSM 2933]